MPTLSRRHLNLSLSQHILRKRAVPEQVRVSRDSTSSAQEYFSVLIKAHDQGGQGEADGSKKGGGGVGGGDDGIQEVYRVKLPGNPVVGEGKPENQNHAMIFTRGEHLQAIDMNQEGYEQQRAWFSVFAYHATSATGCIRYRTSPRPIVALVAGRHRVVV